MIAAAAYSPRFLIAGRPGEASARRQFRNPATEEVLGDIPMAGAAEVGAALESRFGGVRQSGFGREGSTAGVREYLEAKFIHRNSGVRSLP